MNRIGIPVLVSVVTVVIISCCSYRSGDSSNSATVRSFNSGDVVALPDTLEDLPFTHDLQRAIDQALLAGGNGFDLGISAAVFVPEYQVWTGVAGHSQPGVLISEDMIFGVGSIAKNFMAALVLKLAEEGVLDLDGEISQWVPALPNIDQSITIRQLLNHTSGIRNVFDHSDFPWVGLDVDYSKLWDIEDVFSSFVLEPYGLPGSVQRYASTNYQLVATIIENSTGFTAPDVLARYFLQPLSLGHTVLIMGGTPPAHFSVAHPWADMDLDGRLDDLAGISRNWIASLTHPVLYSTPENLTRWMNAMYRDHSILSQNSLEQMLTFPEVADPDPEGMQYGLGVIDLTDWMDIPTIGHTGSAPGYTAAALYMPDLGVSAAVTINTGESPPDLGGSLLSHAWTRLSRVIAAQLEK